MTILEASRTEKVTPLVQFVAKVSIASFPLDGATHRRNLVFGAVSSFRYPDHRLVKFATRIFGTPGLPSTVQPTPILKFIP